MSENLPVVYNARDGTVPLEGSKSELIENFEKKLKSEVFGQERAIQKVLSAISIIDSSLHGLEKPVSPLLFAGPPGSGKTLLAKIAAEAWLGKPDDDEYPPLIVVSGENYTQEHSGATLVGAPAGYIGHGKTPSPLEDVGLFDYIKTSDLVKYIVLKNIRDELGKAEISDDSAEKIGAWMHGFMDAFLDLYAPYRSIVLFDEMEKMHPVVQKQLLSILNDGFLRLNTGQVIDFRRSLIIFTSNIGTGEIRKTLEGTSMGFRAQGVAKDEIDQEIYNIVKNEIKKHLAPELYSRIGHDGIVVFHALSEEDFRKIIDKEINVLNNLIQQGKLSGSFLVRPTPEFYEFILEKADAPTEGARQINRLMHKYVLEPLALHLESGAINHGDIVLLFVDDTGDKKSVEFRRVHRVDGLKESVIKDNREEIMEEDIRKLMPSVATIIEVMSKTSKHHSAPEDEIDDI